MGDCRHRVKLYYLIIVCSILLLVMISSSLVSAAADHIVTARPVWLDWSSAVLIRVDQSGKGDYVKIQDAIDAVPAGNKEPYFIWVKPGIYREKVVVPENKPLITISGSSKSPDATIISWSDSGDNIKESATLTVLASHFVARLITIKNSYGYGKKAVAVRVSGDRAAFYGCRMLSYQDTLLDERGRHYYRNCYIQGSTDFICGNALSIFEKCHIHSLSQGELGAITAQRRMSPREHTGFIFINCRVTGSGHTVLGRPWGPYSRVIFAFSYFSAAVLPQGWNDWGKPTNHKTVVYGQYRCYGPGANWRDRRVDWAREFSAQEVAPFLTKSLIHAQLWLRTLPTKFKKTIYLHH